MRRAGITICLLLWPLASGGAPATKHALLIVALGDSTTAGTPFFRSPLEEPPDGRGDPQGQYAHWMMKDHPDWQVLNRGINGQRTDEIKARFHRDVVKVKPRYVITLAGVNDIFQNYPLTDIERDLLWMYQQAKANGIIPIAASVLPFDRSSEVQARKIRALNRWVKRQADAQGIPFCDLNEVVRDPQNPNRLKGSPDGLHPDIEGYKNMGQALTKLIEKLEAHGGVALKLQLTSPAFVQGSHIPRKYTCDGQNVSPELDWTNPKEGTQSFALVVDDPDAPAGTWVHWVLYNIPANERGLPENFPKEAALPNGSRQLTTDFGTPGYGGPCPPSGTHRYFFRLYALDTSLPLPANAQRRDLDAAMKGHVLEQTELMGTYARAER